MTFPTADALSSIVTDYAGYARNTATTKTLLGLALVIGSSSSNVARMAAVQAYKVMAANKLLSDTLEDAIDAYTEQCGTEGLMLDAYDLVGLHNDLYTVSRTDGGTVLVLTSVRNGYRLEFTDQSKKFLVVG